ncbi:hypothetical protein AB1N83_006299 [Pleurotus pulmonarius]
MTGTNKPEPAHSSGRLMQLWPRIPCPLTNCAVSLATPVEEFFWESWKGRACVLLYSVYCAVGDARCPALTQPRRLDAHTQRYVAPGPLMCRLTLNGSGLYWCRMVERLVKETSTSPMETWERVLFDSVAPRASELVSSAEISRTQLTDWTLHHSSLIASQVASNKGTRSLACQAHEGSSEFSNEGRR